MKKKFKNTASAVNKMADQPLVTHVVHMALWQMIEHNYCTPSCEMTV